MSAVRATTSTPEPSEAPSAEVTPLSLDTLIEARGLVAPDVLARARLVQAETGERLGAIITRLGLLSEQALAEAIAAALPAPLATAAHYPASPPPEAAVVSVRFLRDAQAVVLRVDPDRAFVAFADPFDAFSRRAMAVVLQRRIQPLVGRASEIEQTLDRLYGPGRQDADLESNADELDLERLRDLASDAPAIRAVNRLISTAVEQRASDIHFEPTETALRVRLRIDGVLRELEPLPLALRASVVSRIKVMAGLNIAERRLPQDGRLRMSVRGHDVDLRVGSSPSLHGETVVMRLLDQSQLVLDYAELGFDTDLAARFQAVLAKPHGIVFVTGPTGSGKTTTLYTALKTLNGDDRKLLTIEDPIEYRLPGVVQTQAAPAIGLTFAAALRGFLRQDPNVIMVGEVRDIETAQVAIQAALVGNLILSTLHTNSAAASLTRLLDIGVEPFRITTTLNAVLGQRLVRRLCPHCRQPVDPRQASPAVAALGIDLKRLWRPVGCPACNQQGFRGRVAILELLVMDRTLAQLVLNRAEAQEIETAAVAAGMRTMLRDGIEKVALGLTTVEEVLRVNPRGLIRCKPSATAPPPPTEP